MAIAEVQVASFTGAWTGSLSGNGTIGNTLFLGAFAYNAVTANTMSSNSPTYNGGAVTGAAKILEVQTPSGQAVYAVIWMLPNIQSAGVTIGLTGVNTTIDANVGLAVIEVSGLGASPLVGSAGGAGAANNPQTATGTSAAPDSGTSGAISSQPQLVLGVSVGFGQDQTAPSSPWLTIGQPSTGPLDCFSYQIVTSSGGTFDFAPAGGSSADWVAGVVTIAPAGSGAVAAAGMRPQRGRQSSRRRHGRQQIWPQGADAAVSAVSPTAGVATGIGTAPAANVAIGANAGVAAGTGTAQPAVASAGANAAVATGTGTSQNATPAAGASAAVAAGTGTAQTAAAAAGVNAVFAHGTGTAQNATPAGGANAVVAAGTGTAQPPVPAVAVNAGIATAVGTALQTTVSTSGSLSVNAGVATAAATARSPAAAVAANAGVAAGIGTALQTTVSSGLMAPGAVTITSQNASPVTLTQSASAVTITSHVASPVTLRQSAGVVTITSKNASPLTVRSQL